MDNLPYISAAELASSNGIILDIRTPEEHADLHLIQPHIFVPLDQLDAREFMKEYNADADRPVLILCRSGRRAIPAAEQFIGAGYANVKIIDGGILACQAQGIDVE